MLGNILCANKLFRNISKLYIVETIHTKKVLPPFWGSRTAEM